MTSNLLFAGWAELPRSERQTGALLDRLTRRPHSGQERGRLPAEEGAVSEWLAARSPL